MRVLCLLFVLSFLPMDYANAQQSNQQENQPQWSGMTNPRARRARPTPKTIDEATFGKETKKPTAPEDKMVQPAKNNATAKIPTDTKTKKTNANLPQLTDGMAERIAQIKGQSLTWEDYEMYPYEEDKSGYYMRIYQLNDGMTLNIGGPSPDYEPRYIYITDGKGDVIKSLKEY